MNKSSNYVKKMIGVFSLTCYVCRMCNFLGGIQLISLNFVFAGGLAMVTRADEASCLHEPCIIYTSICVLLKLV